MAEHCNCGAERPKPPVRIPATGTYLVVDGVVTQVHAVRVGDEADYSVNRCSPGDICGAQDGCNT